MSMFLSRIVRMAAQRLITSPQVRHAAAKAAVGVAEEARLIARERDKARAAGRSVRRVFTKLQGRRDDA